MTNRRPTVRDSAVMVRPRVSLFKTTQFDSPLTGALLLNSHASRHA